MASKADRVLTVGHGAADDIKVAVDSWTAAKPTEKYQKGFINKAGAVRKGSRERTRQIC